MRLEIGSSRISLKEFAIKEIPWLLDHCFHQGKMQCHGTVHAANSRWHLQRHDFGEGGDNQSGEVEHPVTGLCFFPRRHNLHPLKTGHGELTSLQLL